MLLAVRRLNVRPSVTLRAIKFSNQPSTGRNVHNKIVFSGVQPTGVPHVRRNVLSARGGTKIGVI